VSQPEARLMLERVAWLLARQRFSTCIANDHSIIMSRRNTGEKGLKSRNLVSGWRRSGLVSSANVPMNGPFPQGANRGEKVRGLAGRGTRITTDSKEFVSLHEAPLAHMRRFTPFGRR
jgi:hypothetical protein